MKATLDPSGKTLRLDFDDVEALRTFAADWLAKQGCLVRLAEALKLWTQLDVELRQAGTPRVELEARVLQVFGDGPGGFATALQATDPGPLERFAAGPPGAAGSPDPGAADAAGDDTETDDAEAGDDAEAEEAST